MASKPSLEDLVGHVVGIKIPCLDSRTTVRVRLHAVEHSGLWIESQQITDWVLSLHGASSSPKSGVLFFPFSQIEFVVGSVDVPSLSDQALNG